MDSTFLIIGVFSAICVIASAWCLLNAVEYEERLVERLRGTSRKPVVKQSEGGNTYLDIVANVVGLFGAFIAKSGMLSRKTITDVQQTLNNAGFSNRNSLGLFIGLKLLLLVLLPAAMVFGGYLFDYEADTTNSVAIICGLGGLLGPDFLIKRLRARYIHGVESGVADMLDLLLICAQSGLSLQPALSRVEQELRTMYPQLAWELSQTATELQIIADARVALTNLGVRTGIESLRRLTSTLAQTLQYGTPLSDALRALSHEMRQETLTRFEEKAARLPILLTIPMILFILPCVFVVVGGPAVIQLVHNFR